MGIVTRARRRTHPRRPAHSAFKRSIIIGLDTRPHADGMMMSEMRYYFAWARQGNMVLRALAFIVINRYPILHCIS